MVKTVVAFLFHPWRYNKSLYRFEPRNYLINSVLKYIWMLNPYNKAYARSHSE